MEPAGQIEVACVPDGEAEPPPEVTSAITPTIEHGGEHRTISAAREATAGTTAGSVPADSLPRKINVNQASEEELQTLPGIGPTLAGRIVEYRRTVGPFQTVDDLANVKGIGSVMLSRLRDLIVAQ